MPGVLCVQYHCELHRLKKWEGSSLSASFLGWGNNSRNGQVIKCEQVPVYWVTAMNRMWKPSVEISPLTHLSFSFLQFVGVCFRAALGPEKPRVPALRGACAVGKGHELHAGAESKGKATPPQSTPAQMPVQCARSVLPYPRR